MLEPVAIPILIKAVDFLFEEGRTILKERRERRRQEANAEPVEQGNPCLPILVNEQSKNIIASKEAAIRERVPENVWSEAEPKVKHLLSLLEVHTRNYYLAKEQYAKWGSALVPLIVANTLAEEEDAVALNMRELQSTLSVLYRKKVVLFDVIPDNDRQR